MPANRAISCNSAENACLKCKDIFVASKTQCLHPQFMQSPKAIAKTQRA